MKKVSEKVPSSVGRLLRHGVFVLSTLESEVLLSHVLGASREYILAHDREDVNADLAELFESYVERVRSGEPVAYITGQKEFFGLDFYVDKRVLIPRPETELLVERALDFLKNFESGVNVRVLDVGTGSGNIAVAIAKNFADADVYALEISGDACEVARINVEQHSLEDRVQVFQSDLLEVIDDSESFDVIVANLPYIGKVKNNFVADSARKYEPSLALFGGRDGLELYKKLFQQLGDRRINFGVLLGEFGFAQRGDLEKLLSQYFDQNWEIEPDLAGIDRVFKVVR